MSAACKQELLRLQNRSPMYAGGRDGDGQGAFHALAQVRSVGVLLLIVDVGPEELEVAGAENLEAILEVLTRCEGLGPEAGAWIVELDERNRSGGAVVDAGVDERGVAAHKQKR